MKNKKEILIWLLLVMPFVYYAIIFKQLPEEIPTHWNAKGEADGFGDKWSPLFVLGFLNFFTFLIMKYAPEIDMGKKEKFGENYVKMRIGIQFFMSAISFIFLLAVQEIEFNSTKVVGAVISLLFAFIGNLVINVKQNSVLGFRLPWTMKSEYVWRKTHQLGGRIWFYGGLACAVSSFFLSSEIFIFAFLGLTFLSIIIICVYSYKLLKLEETEAQL